MKYLLTFCCAYLLLACSSNTSSPTSANQVIYQDSNRLKKPLANPYVPVDVSPMDMAYFPTDYPIQKMNEGATNLPVMRVIYSRPHRAGRVLFGNLVKWGQPWRLGANEATEIEFFQPVTINTKKVDKGRYLMYVIPNPTNWTIVLNTNLYAWGLKFNQAKDVLLFEAPSTTTPQSVEYFTLFFEKAATGATLIIAWENTEVRLPIQF